MEKLNLPLGVLPENASANYVVDVELKEGLGHGQFKTQSYTEMRNKVVEVREFMAKQPKDGHQFLSVRVYRDGELIAEYK